jgi:hypothetical protein
MAQRKKTTPKLEGSAYDAEMSDLREKLNGRPYCQRVQDLVPEFTKYRIRNIVNGRGKNQLVLAALKIVVHKMDSGQQQEEKRVSELTKVLVELEATA